ncbi:hypothetical protein FPV67DRAFT_1682464 [Lyophyllum atratum]|nr:hypothetical protein FPV67DRAFT_1682464 [Lyophyllum atratum]
MSSAAFTSSPALSVDTMTSDSTNSDSTSDAYAVYEDRAKNGRTPNTIIDIRRKIEGWSGGYSYLDLRSSEEYKAVLFGQVMAASAGTLLSAKGNHYAGRPGDIVYVDVARLAHQNPGTGAEDASKRVKKRELRTAEKAVKKGGAGAKTHVGLVSSGMEGPVVTAGAFMSRGSCQTMVAPTSIWFKINCGQQDVRDPDDQLIPPWEMHTALRPGTLIMAECTLNAFHIKDKRGDGPDRRIYQVNAQSIRVLDYSKESVVIPTRPVVPTSGSQSDSVSSDASVGSTRPPPSDAFANFQMNKRRRSNPEKTTIVLDASVPAKERPAAKPKTKGRKNAEPSTGDASKADAMEDGPPSN